MLSKHSLHWKERKQKILEKAVEGALGNEEYYDKNFGKSASRYVATSFTELATCVYIASNVVITCPSVTQVSGKMAGNIPRTIHHQSICVFATTPPAKGLISASFHSLSLRSVLTRYDFNRR